MVEVVKMNNIDVNESPPFYRKNTSKTISSQTPEHHGNGHWKALIGLMERMVKNKEESILDQKE